MSHTIQQNRLAVEAKVKSLINNDLKEICRGENLAVSGVKAQLQSRILEHLGRIIQKGDAHSFERMRYRVNHHGTADNFASTTSNLGSASISPAPNHQMAAAYGRPVIPGFQSSSKHQSHPSRALAFKDSPFYPKPEPISQAQELTEMQSNRHTVAMPLSLTQATCDRLHNKNIRVMIYCAAAMGLGSYGAKHDISFPNQIEIKVNGDDLKSNFKGLKNKPGTTKPADITDMLRKAPGYNNSIQITYALTTKKYTVVINLVDRRSADSLATELADTGKRISKDYVVKEMLAKANDPDIVTTSTVMSLKDPISTMRMTLPCRATVCTHNQCFDGSYFLQLQEQAPTWTCPVCSKTLTYHSLCVDQYVQDILEKTTTSIEQITIEPDGQWRPVVQGDDATGSRGSKGPVRATYDNDSDEDIIEIQDTRVDRVKNEAASITPGIAQQTPPLSSREASTAAPAPVRPGSKRGSAVIDLTLSDDDEPPRPAKRMYTSQSTSYNTPASLFETRLTDVGSRQSGHLGQDFPSARPDTLPPLQLGQSNGGLHTGQRLPWPTGNIQYPGWSGGLPDSQGSFSRSPG